jgi:cytochrome c
MALPFASRVRGLSAGILLCLAALSDAAISSKVAARGKLILQQNCGRCHAIEAVGDSPLKDAPPMRDIYSRFHPRELQERLTEGLGSKHTEMPQIKKIRTRAPRKIFALNSPPLPPEMPTNRAHVCAWLSASLAETSKNAANIGLIRSLAFVHRRTY